MTGWTFGTELELADVKRDTALPGRSAWDRQDYTIVNSNGVANDPSGKLWAFGGEVNTEPTSSVAEQVAVIDRVLLTLSPAPAVNYRTNFHVHIRVPGLAADLPAVQRLLTYVADHGAAAMAAVDPIPAKPTYETYPDREERAGASQRWRRRVASHHTMLPPGRLLAASAAQTVEDVRRAHAPVDAAGRPQYQLATRCGINLRALWEAPGQTIEFRHWCMSLDRAALGHAIQWCADFLSAALDGGSTPVAGSPLPWQPLYDHWLETRYRATSRRYHSDAEIRATLAQWTAEGTLHERPCDLHRQPLAQPAPGSLF